MNELNIRLLVDVDSIPDVISVLDKNFINNDIDNGNRIMVSEDDLDEAIDVLDNIGFCVDII